jgi:hypothetical protein
LLLWLSQPIIHLCCSSLSIIGKILLFKYKILLVDILIEDSKFDLILPPFVIIRLVYEIAWYDNTFTLWIDISFLAIGCTIINLHYNHHHCSSLTFLLYFSILKRAMVSNNNISSHLISSHLYIYIMRRSKNHHQHTKENKKIRHQWSITSKLINQNGWKLDNNWRGWQKVTTS